MLKTLTTLALVAAGTAISAAPMRYDCKLQTHSRQNWAPKEAIYWIDPTNQTIRAIDPFIQHVFKEPISTKVEMSGPPIYKFSYQLELPSRQSGNIRVTYGVRFDAQKNRLTVEAFLGNNSRERSTGRCALRK
ncbi:MAG: hypothetical protein ACI92Z_003791 [Paracoccaceae bacterium]|jgi:hypothetical protein